MAKNPNLPDNWLVKHSNDSRFQDLVIRYLNEECFGLYSGDNNDAYYGVINEVTRCVHTWDEYYSDSYVISLDQFEAFFTESNSPLSELPKYWAVLSNGSIKDMKPVTDFMRKQYGSAASWEGNLINTYYGYDGNGRYGGTDHFQDIDSFRQYVTVLTIDEFIRLTNPQQRTLYKQELPTIKKQINNEQTTIIGKAVNVPRTVATINSGQTITGHSISGRVRQATVRTGHLKHKAITSSGSYYLEQEESDLPF